jgi:hypothetical protein
MLTLIRTQTKITSIRRSLEALLGQISAEVWLGEIPIRVFRDIEKLLKSDTTSDSYVGKLGRTINVSKFYSIISGSKTEVMFFEIYKNKSLLRNKN